MTRLNQGEPDGSVRELLTVLLDLSTLSDRKSIAIDRGDAEELDDVLAMREPLVEREVSLGGRLEDQGTSTPRLASDLAECSRLWSAITQRDARDLCELRRQRDDLAGELERAGRGARAAAAYAGMPSAPRFQNREA